MKQIICFCCLGLILLVFNLPQVSWSNDYTIIPSPQKIVVPNTNKSVLIDQNWIIIDHLNNENRTRSGGSVDILEKLRTIFFKKGFEISVVKPDSLQNENKKKITICSFADLPYVKKNIDNTEATFAIPYEKKDTRFGESYFLDVYCNKKKEGILIVAGGAPGAFYAIQTLEQLVEKDGKIKCTQIIDYPDMRIRGAMFKIDQLGQIKGKDKFSSKHLASIKKDLRNYFDFKLNTFLFWSPKYYDMGELEKQFFKNLFQFCRDNFIEPIPMIGSKLWDIPNCKIVPEAVEGYWVKNEIFHVDDGYLKPVLSSNNIIKNGSFEILSTDKKTAQYWKAKIVDTKNYWQIIEEQYSNKSEIIKEQNSKIAQCVVEGLEKSYRLKLQPNYGDKALIPVIPSSYYELGFRCKRAIAGKISMRVSVKQFDDNFKLLETGGNNLNTFNLWPKWKCRWMSVFTRPECRYINISFMPHTVSNQSGKIYLDDVVLKRMNGALFNIFNNSGVRVEVKNTDGSVLYQEGVDYIVLENTIKNICRFTNNSIKKAFLKVTKNSRIRINQKLRISYDTKPLEFRSIPRSKLCPSSFETYKLYHHTFSDLLFLKPKYIHISMDEHRCGFNRDSRCLKRGLSNSEIFAQMITNLNNILHSNSEVEVLPGIFIKGLNRPDIRLIMWDDMINPWHNGSNLYYQNAYGGKTGRTYLAMPDTPISDLNDDNTSSKFHISNDIVMNSWWYNKSDAQGVIKKSPVFYEKRGFDYIGCAWGNEENVKLWSKFLSGKKALGLIAATWNNKRKGIPFVAEYSWKRINYK